MIFWANSDEGSVHVKSYRRRPRRETTGACSTRQEPVGDALPAGGRDDRRPDRQPRARRDRARRIGAAGVDLPLLPHGGNSSTQDRKALTRRYLAHFPLESIRYLLADREFVGAEWFKFLDDINILFAIRLRENLRVTDEAGHELTLHARLRRAGRTRFFHARMGTRDEALASGAPLLGFAARRLKDEWLIVVTNLPPRAALNAYRKRWAIECLSPRQDPRPQP